MGSFIAAAPDCARPRAVGVCIDRVVIHCQDGTQRGTIAWFRSPGRTPPTAAHFCIGRDGDVVQMVLERDKAIHAGSPREPHWNDRSIGVELEARNTPWPADTHPAFPVDDFPDALLDAAAGVVADVCRRHDIPVDRHHIVGHHEVPGATHIDPGEHFPWEAFMRRVEAAFIAQGGRT